MKTPPNAFLVLKSMMDLLLLGTDEVELWISKDYWIKMFSNGLWNDNKGYHWVICIDERNPDNFDDRLAIQSYHITSHNSSDLIPVMAPLVQADLAQRYAKFQAQAA